MNLFESLSVGDRVELSDRSFFIKTEDGYKNEYGIEYTLTPTIEPVVLKDFLSHRTHSDIEEFVRHRPFILKNDDIFGRKSINNHDVFRKIHQQLVPIVSDIVSSPVMPSYTFLSMYDERGVCHLHTDKDSCKLTLCYVINEDKEWPLYINGEEYILKPNDAILYSGTDHVHFRKKIPGTYHWNALFHFTMSQ